MKMPLKHDFEGAIGKIKEHGETACLFELESTPTILFALKLAQKVTGEPSEGMSNAAIMDHAKNKLTHKYSDTFKAMVNQAIKEIESDESNNH